MRLYSYWRSTAAYRVRIALNLKGIDYDLVPVDLVKDGGGQHAPDYVALNPAHLVPTLVTADGTALTQSLAIIDWLEAMHPTPPLLPAEPGLRARTLAAAHLIAMDIHPVNNLRIMQELERRFGASAEDKADWMGHWMRVGFDALETMLDSATSFAFTDTPSIADICLVAQIYNARRWGLDPARWPRLAAIDAAASALPAFAMAAPEAQPDAPQS